MIAVGNLTVVDATGAAVPLDGDLLCFVEHAFTPEAGRVLRLAAQAHAAGGRFRVVSVDSPSALAAWVAAMGAEVPVGADTNGALARRLGRFDEETFAYRPGWAQIDREGNVVAMGEEHFPQDPTLPIGRMKPPPHVGGAGVPGWAYYAGAAALALAAGTAYWRNPPGEAVQAPEPAPPPAVVAEPAVAAAVPAQAALPKPQPGQPKGQVGSGWYAVPPALAGNLVRVVEGALEVEGADLAKPPMACLSETTAMTGPIHVSGSWELDHVGTPRSKGGRVGVRLLDAAGKILPNEAVPGGAQVFVASGRLVQDWTAFNQTIPLNAATSQVRVCVDNLGGTGVVRVRDVVVSVE